MVVREDALPVGQLAPRGAFGQRREALGGVPEGGRLARQLRLLAGLDGVEGPLEVAEHQPQGDSVGDHVVEDQGHPVPGLGALDPEAADRSFREVETGVEGTVARHDREAALAVACGPALVRSREREAQRVVVSDHRVRRASQLGQVHRAPEAQTSDHPRAVRMGGRVVQGPPLHRRQRLLAAHLALLGLHLAALPDHGRELRDRVVGEEHRRAERQPHLAGLRSDLQRQRHDRVPAEVEEIVVDTHRLDAEGLLPERGDGLFGGVGRRHRWHGPSLPVGGRERAAVHLAARAQGHRRQDHQRRGHHVVGQGRLKRRAPLAPQRSGGRSPVGIAGELGVPRLARRRRRRRERSWAAVEE